MANINKMSPHNGRFMGEDNQVYNIVDLMQNQVHTLGSKTVTENGVYNASDDHLSGYKKVTVDVPEAELGTKNITTNGTYRASNDNLDGYSEVTVDVPGADTYLVHNFAKGFCYTNDPTYICVGGNADKQVLGQVDEAQMGEPEDNIVTFIRDNQTYFNNGGRKPNITVYIEPSVSIGQYLFSALDGSSLDTAGISKVVFSDNFVYPSTILPYPNTDYLLPDYRQEPETTVEGTALEVYFGTGITEFMKSIKHHPMVKKITFAGKITTGGHVVPDGAHSRLTEFNVEFKQNTQAEIHAFGAFYDELLGYASYGAGCVYTFSYTDTTETGGHP